MERLFVILESHGTDEIQDGTIIENRYNFDALLVRYNLITQDYINKYHGLKYPDYTEYETISVPKYDFENDTETMIEITRRIDNSIEIELQQPITAKPNTDDGIPRRETLG